MVEDVFSAIKCSRIKPTTALCGTHIPLQRIEKLCKLTTRITLVLDPDAVQKALKYAKEFSGLFDRVRIVQLPKDPKDCSMDILKKEIEGT